VQRTYLRSEARSQPHGRMTASRRLVACETARRRQSGLTKRLTERIAILRATAPALALRPVAAGYTIQFGLVLSKLGRGELELRRLEYSKPHRRGNRRPVRHHEPAAGKRRQPYFRIVLGG
jgi:hypothetical protein